MSVEKTQREMMVHSISSLLLPFNFGENQTKIRRIQRVVEGLAVPDAAAASQHTKAWLRPLIHIVNPP